MNPLERRCRGRREEIEEERLVARADDERLAVSQQLWIVGNDERVGGVGVVE